MKNKIPTISITAICLLALIILSSGIQSEKGGKMQQKYYYCEYCGHRFPSVRLLTFSPVCPPSRRPEQRSPQAV